MDLGTLIGIIVGNGLILSAMLMGGTMDMFVDVAGLNDCLWWCCFSVPNGVPDERRNLSLQSSYLSA